MSLLTTSVAAIWVSVGALVLAILTPLLAFLIRPVLPVASALSCASLGYLLVFFYPFPVRFMFFYEFFTEKTKLSLIGP